MFKCCDCDKTFDNPKVVNTSYESYYGVDNMVDGKTECTIQVCPYCGSDMLIEYIQYSVQITKIKPIKLTNDAYIISYIIYNEDDEVVASGDTHYEGEFNSVTELQDYILELEGLY